MGVWMQGWMRWVAWVTTAWWLVIGSVLLASGLLPQREFICNDVFIVETSPGSSVSPACMPPPPRWVPDGFPVGYQADSALQVAVVCLALALLAVSASSPLGRRIASKHVVRVLVRAAAVPFAFFGVAAAIIGAVEQAVGLSLFGLGLLGVGLTLIAASRTARRLSPTLDESVHS